MLYTCTNCRLIIPNELAMNQKKCPICGRVPNLEFKTADSMLSQGYRQYDTADSGPRTSPADPATRRDPVSIPDVPVESLDPTTPQGAPQPPTARSGNSRLDWMHQRETPVPEPTTPTFPDPGPSSRPEPAPRPNPQHSGGSSSGSWSEPSARPGGSIMAPPTRRPGSSLPAETGSSTIEGGPTGRTTGTGPFNPGNINFSFILQLLILLAVSIIVGILIYSIWSMREQIVQTLTTIFTFVVIGAAAIFLLRRRF